MQENSDYIKKRIGLTLKEWIENSQYTQADIARILDVSPQYINGLCSGKTIGKGMAKRIANQFGLSESFLLTGEGSLIADLKEEDIPESLIKAREAFNANSTELQHMREKMEAMRQTIESYQTAIRAQNELIARLKKELNQSYPNSGIFASDDMVNLTTKPNPKQEK